MFGIIKKGLARPALSGFDSPAYSNPDNWEF